VGTPDYSDLLLDKYISVIEIVNPMHRMWSDGRWNKLTMAHGCYWENVIFRRLYQNMNLLLLVCFVIVWRNDEQTGENGFHYVDEAAPPALMRIGTRNPQEKIVRDLVD
jgi:hypothetical protein